MELEDLLFEKMGVEACREADDLKLLWKLTDNIKGVDPD